MNHGALRALATVLVLANSITLGAQDAPVRVRGYGADAGDLIVKGVARSPTFRNMVSRLEAGDVIVFVELSRCAGSVPGCLLWAAPAAGSRRLLARVDRFGRSENELIALLAHELQHAVEVASVADITDESSFRHFFGRQGWKSSDGFETAEARAITRKVFVELTR